MILACSLSLMSCAQESGLLNVDDFEAKLSELEDAVLLDVRTQGEYDDGHLAGSVMIDYRGVEFREKVSELDSDKPVLVYCRSGRRSHQAFMVLEELGFKEIYEMQGGMNAWEEAEKEVER
jgi:rhodanese-related sulfurtransferase